jgi:hypothetical protein
MVAYLLGITALLGVSALFAAPAAPELPEGWREIPELALEPGVGQVRVDSRRGFGDPANGCFALVQQASGRYGNLQRVRTALAAGLKLRGLEVSGDGEEMAVRGLGIEGRIRTALRAEAGGRFAAVSTACFYNGRQPDRCKVQCDALLDRLGGGS